MATLVTAAKETILYLKKKNQPKAPSVIKTSEFAGIALTDEAVVTSNRMKS